MTAKTKGIPKGVPAWLVLMGVLTMTGPVAVDMYLPAFPSMTQDLGAAAGQVERTMAVYLIGVAIGQLIYGPLADAYGRKPPLYGGLILFAGASLGCALATSIESLTWWRLVQALGGSACMVVPRAVIRDNYDTQAAARALSLLMLITGVAPVAAPVVGGQILHYLGWRPIFWLLGIFGLTLLLTMHFSMKETLRPEHATRLSFYNMTRTYADLLKHRQFMMLSVAGGLSMGGVFAYIIASPRILIDIYGTSPRLYGVLFSLNAVGMIAASQINARLLKKRQPYTVLRPVLWLQPAISCFGLVLVLAGWMPLPLLLICLMGFTACQGFIGPNSAALALTEQVGRLGAASALMGTLQFLCATLIGLAVSVWQSDDAASLMGMMLLAGILSNLAGRAGLRRTVGR